MFTPVESFSEIKKSRSGQLWADWAAFVLNTKDSKFKGGPLGFPRP